MLWFKANAYANLHHTHFKIRMSCNKLCINKYTCSLLYCMIFCVITQHYTFKSHIWIILHSDSMNILQAGKVETNMTPWMNCWSKKLEIVPHSSYDWSQKFAKAGLVDYTARVDITHTFPKVTCKLPYLSQERKKRNESKFASLTLHIASKQTQTSNACQSCQHKETSKSNNCDM